MRIRLLEESLEEHTSALIGHLHQYILETSGLLPLIQALGEWDPKVSSFPSRFSPMILADTTAGSGSLKS